jgi:hypothetical protein
MAKGAGGKGRCLRGVLMRRTVAVIREVPNQGLCTRTHQTAEIFEPGEYMHQKTRGDEGREREQIKSLEWGDDSEGASGEKRCAGGE